MFQGWDVSMLEGWKVARLECFGSILQNALTFWGKMYDGVSFVGLHQHWIVHDGEFCELQYFNAWDAKI